ncbi:hypothetical protein TL16_g09081 [Triparma laevis f. inornata]|uniref:Uncharacterized protein n=1 Tax=Triparma laevis f. inornata TaxID=1714386 RepID=A0A9W7B5K6_9STRA|nr:hypothetical protein TL16_g09081 [Triparma laevis f. inornata]
MAFKLRWETLRCSVMADRSDPFIVVFRDEPSIDGIVNPKDLKPDQFPPKPTVNQPGGVDFWSTRYENDQGQGQDGASGFANHGHGPNEYDSVGEQDSANDLLSIDESFGYLSLDSEIQPSPVDVNRQDLSAPRGAAFSATTAANLSEEINEPAWDDVRHWNRENCGWTMSREKRFKPKMKKDKYRDIYVHEENGMDKRAQTAFSLPKTTTPANSSYPPTEAGDASSLGGSRSYRSYPATATTAKRPHVTDRILGPGDYDHQDPWEVEQTCGFVPKSSMFASSSKRDLFLNDAFSKTKMGKVAITGPMTPAKILHELEKRGEAIAGEAKQHPILDRKDILARQLREREVIQSVKKQEVEEEKKREKERQKREAEAKFWRSGAKPKVSRLKQRPMTQAGRESKMKAKRAFRTAQQAPKKTLSSSSSAPTIGLDAARWDQRGQSFTKSVRKPPVLSFDPNNKKIYRKVKDIRSGKVTIARVERDSITTPNAQDLFLVLETTKSKVDPSLAAIITSPAKIYQKVAALGSPNKK